MSGHNLVLLSEIEAMAAITNVEEMFKLEEANLLLCNRRSSSWSIKIE